MKFGYTINNKLMMNSNGKLLGVDPYNPLNLPQGTIRVRTNDGQPPINGSYNRVTLVEGTTDVYDVFAGGDEFLYTLNGSTNVIDVLGVNSEGKIHSNSMFHGCTALSSVPSFDTTKITNMDSMFEGCSSLTDAPYLYTSNVTHMWMIFKDCASLTSVPLYDTSKVTSAGGFIEAFMNCSSLTSVPLFDLSNTDTLDRTFYGCTSLVSVPKFDIANVYGMPSTFENCTSLTTIPLFDTRNLKYMNNTFKNCTSLTSIPLFDTVNLMDMGYAFDNCVNVQSGALALYKQASTQSIVPGHTHTFTYCGRDTQTGSAELAQIPSDWK